jgi:hypothetical protein
MLRNYSWHISWSTVCTSAVGTPASSRRSHGRSSDSPGVLRILASVVMLVVCVLASAGVNSGRARAALSGRTISTFDRPPRIVPGSGSGAPRDGVWRPVTYPVSGGAPALFTIFHPDPSLPGLVAYVGWFDHRRTQLGLYPGLQEPPGVAIRGSGSVPHDQRWRLLATFNGGFKAAGRAGGFLVNGHVDEPLQPGLATIVERRDRSLEIVRWANQFPVNALILARQNLLPLVWNSVASPAVTQPWRWGDTLHGVPTVWRTAIGLTGRGDLVYVAAPDQSAESLAAIMVRVGAVRALELDINPEWPSLIAYRHRGGRDPVAVVPNPQQSPYRYLVPDDRDFFAVYARPGGASSVPFG